MQMVVELLGKSQSLTTAANAGRSSVWNLNKSMDSLIATMERERHGASESARQMQILELADKGATISKVEYALALNKELESLQALRTAEAAELATKQRQQLATEQLAASKIKQEDADLRVLMGLERTNIELLHGADAAKRYEISMSTMSAEAKELALQLVDEAAAVRAANVAKAEGEAGEKRAASAVNGTLTGLKRKAFELAHGADAMVLYELKANGASDTEVALADRLLKSAAASRDKANADSEAERAATRETAAIKAKKVALDQEYAAMLLSAGIVDRNGTMTRTNAMGGVSANHQQINAFTAANPGKTNLQDNIIMLQQEGYHQERVARGIELRNAAQQRLNQTTSGGAGALRTNTLAIQALAFGVQDAAQVYGTTGLAGAISASANNLIFMTSLLSPQLAIITAVAVAGGQFAAVLLPMAFNSKKMGDETKRLSGIYQEHSEILVKMAEARRDFNNSLADATTNDQAGALVKQTKREGEAIATEMAARQQAIADLEKRKAAAKAKEDSARMGQTLLGRAGEMVGATAVAGVGEQKEIDKQIAAERLKLTELKNAQRINSGQQTAAAQQARKAEEQSGLASDSRARVEQAQQRSQQESELLRQQNQERAKGDEQYIKQRAELEKSLGEELRTEDENKRFKTLQALGERQREIDQWLGEGRISVQDAMTLRMQSRMAAGKSLQAEADKAKIDPLKEDIKNRKKLLDDQTKDTSGQDLRAVEANSSEGMKKIFDALGGNSDPSVDVAKNTQAMVMLMKADVAFREKQLKALENLKPVKTGGS